MQLAGAVFVLMPPASFPASPASACCVLATHEYDPFRGGVAAFVRELAWAARQGGFSVEVWTVDYRGRGDVRVPPEESHGSPPVVRLASDGRLTPGGLLAFAAGLWRRRKALRDRPAILLSVGAQMAFFLLATVGAVSPGRVVCFFHGSEILRFRRRAIWRWLAKRFYARAGGFGVNSFHVEQLLRESGLIPEGAPVVVARCAVPMALRRQPAPTEESADGFWRVLTVARLHPRKGQVEVARALALLPEEQRGRLIYQMAGVGEEGYRREIEAACRAGGVRCEFLGACDDAALARAYASATLYAQASRTLPQSVEGFGMTFLEAAFHGCPAAAFRSGGVDEAVRDGVTGLLVPEGDLPALAAAMGRLLGDPALRARMGAAGREFASGFRWEDAGRVLVGMASEL